MRRTVLAAAGALLLAAALLWGTRGPTSPDETSQRTTSAAGHREERLRDAGDARPFAAPPGVSAATPPSLPESLAGTEPDGELRVDVDGHFVADAATRAFFDYYLAAAGEQSLHSLRAQIVSAIEARLPPAAALEAVAALDAYLDYRRRSRRLVEDGTVPEDLGERLELLRRVRREALGPELAEAFFGLEEATVAADLARREILSRADLGPAERERLLWENEQALPEPVRAARARALLPVRLQEDEAALRAAGGNDEDVHALRRDMVGSEAAERLAELDREEAAWQARLDDFRMERSAIEADPGLDQAQRDARLRTLLEERFTVNERLRVGAIEQIR
jgi:lipase chaperone LimK